VDKTQILGKCLHSNFTITALNADVVCSLCYNNTGCLEASWNGVPVHRN